MDLRQIIRNQKLSNFNYKLIDFISEQDKVPSGKKTGDDPHFWYKNPQTGKTVSSTDQNAADKGYEIATKEELPKEKQPKKAAVDKGGEERDPQIKQDPEDKDIESIGDEFRATPLSDEELDDAVETHFGGGPGQTGSYDVEGQTGDPGDENWPNDAIAKQTSWDTGHSKGQPPAKQKSTSTGRPIEAAPGDAGSLFNELGSNEVADLLYKLQDTGDDLSDKQLAQILHKQFGGTHAAKQNGSGDPKRKKDYNDKLLAAARAGRRKNDRMKTAMKNGADQGFDSENIENVETLYGSADSIQAAKNQVANANKFFGQDGEITEVPSDERTKDEFRESIGSSQLAAARKLTGGRVVKSRAQLEELGLPFPADLIELERGDSGKIVGINEEKMEKYINDLFPEDFDSLSDDEKSEKIKNFMEAVVLSAGGGNNPADTTTVIKDKSGNLIVLQHSDKVDLKAQLANSTPAKEFDRAGEEIDRMVGNGDLSEDKAIEALSINNDAAEAIKEEEEKLAEVKEQPLKDLAAFVDNPKQAKQILDVLNNPEDDPTLTGNYWDKFRNQGDRKNMSDVEALQDFMNLLADPDHKVSGPENRMIEKLRTQMIKNPDRVTDSDGTPWGASQLDSSMAQAEIRKASVKILQDRVEALNAIETEDGNRLGDVVETRKLIDMLHLYQMDKPSRGVYVNGMTETVAGADGVTKENLRKCLGVENSNDLIGKIKVGPPQIPEGATILDKDLGVPEAFLTRNSKEPEVNESGQVLYWLYDDTGKKVGKTDNEKESEESSPRKKKVAEPVGSVTSQKALAYYEDEETGERFEIAHMDTRAKGGPQAPLGTGYGWSTDMQKCLAGKTDKIGESIKYFGDILDELKQNTLGHHWMKAEEDYPVHYFIREINEGSLN